jgi:Uma2 family endonuclease
MMQLPQLTRVEDFVAWEERQSERYEFAEGDISLFPGATARHEIIVVNLCLALRSVVAARHVRGSGLKQVTATSSRYPDVSVSFDERDTVELPYARFPALLIEVLSPATHATDRGPKFDEYRTIETLREYVMVDSRKRWVQLTRRRAGEWIVSLPQSDGVVRFESLGLDVRFDDLYAGTDL